MLRRSTIWFIVAILFNAMNIGGAVYALTMGEMQHASLHAVLILPGALAIWVLTHRREQRAAYTGGRLETPSERGEISERLSQLERSVDAVALEVERIGEGQRFMTKVLAEDAARPAEAKPERTGR